MAEALVKFFLKRLDSLLLQETETETFSGLEDQIERLTCTLREIGVFFENKGSREGDAAVLGWVKELRDLIDDMEDRIDEFIIQMDQQNGPGDKLALTNCFRSELQKIESCLAETVHRMKQLYNSTTIIEGKKDDNEKSFHGMEEGETVHEVTEPNNSGEEEDNEGNSHGTDEGQTSASSSSFPFKSNYIKLPYYLQYSLLYCCIFPENYWIHKGKLIRLLVAEGLIQEKVGKIMEDIAEDNINELINQGMLQVKDARPDNGTKLTVASPYRQILNHKIELENFINAWSSSDSSIPTTTRHVSIYADIMRIIPNLDKLRPRSMFLFGNQNLSDERGNWLNFYGAKFLRLLDLENTKLKRLPDEVEDLIHLKYLGLKHTDLNDLPVRLGNLRALQTLDIRWCGKLTELSIEVLNLVRLRHLKMFKNMGGCGMKLPAGIGRLRSLLTLTGIHPGGGIARELGDLIHLRRLGVMDVNEENVSELFSSLMKMKDLLSLSLEAIHSFRQGRLVLLESFSPPPLLRKLRLEGILEKLPNWIGSMENLTNLRLGFSHLSENPTTVLQLLPNLKKLTLWNAYDAKQLGKEFCMVGGFPKLEVLSIASHFLEEWTELEDGALPSLKYLSFHNCSRLRMLPEGLQFVTTLKQLDLLPLLDEHAERLKPFPGNVSLELPLESKTLEKLRSPPQGSDAQVVGVSPTRRNTATAAVINFVKKPLIIKGRKERVCISPRVYSGVYRENQDAAYELSTCFILYYCFFFKKKN